MEGKRIYIYGFIPNIYSPKMFRSLEECGVYAIPLKNTLAIVSDWTNTSFSFSDREELGRLLVDHQKTIENLIEKGFNMIIPIQLGTIVNTKEDVYKILASGHEIIVDSLNKIEQKFEIDLAVTWVDFPEFINSVAADPEIVTLNQAILEKGDEVTQMDQIKIGKMIEEKIKERNRTLQLDIINTLSLISEDIKINEVMNDQMVTNTAYLVHRSKREAFEKGLEGLDKAYEGKLNFKMVGPLPCYSFYTIEVKELNRRHVLEAGEELGLSGNLTEGKVKFAYQEKAKVFHPDVNKGLSNSDNFSRIKEAYNTLLEYLHATELAPKEKMFPSGGKEEMGSLFQVKIRD